jgi:hypothetical protein
MSNHNGGGKKGRLTFFVAILVIAAAFGANLWWYHKNHVPTSTRTAEQKQRFVQDISDKSDGELDKVRNSSDNEYAQTLAEQIHRQQRAQAIADNPQLAFCGGRHELQADGGMRVVINDKCGPNYSDWIYDDDREITAEVRVMNMDGIALDLIPELSAGRGSKAKPLGGYRFLLQGSVNYNMKTKTTGGQIIQVTPTH